MSAGRRVILNADDLGYEPEVTRGILEAMREGVVSSTTFIVNGPYSEPAGRQARGLAVGLHLNLVRFEAVSSGAPLVEAVVDQLDAAFVETEVLAQLDRLAGWLGAPATHVDVHKHAHRFPRVLEGLARAAGRAKLPVRSLDAGMRAALRAHGVHTNDAFLGDAGEAAFWTEAEFARQLSLVLASGVTELMCHPGYAPTALRSGYGPQREVERRTFCSPTARAALAAAGLTLESWAGV